jgi:hypothetical protein
MLTITVMALSAYASMFVEKNKSRDFYRGLGGILELVLRAYRFAPILHLRRETKPIAAKPAERAKSCHKAS